jgi:hypothetical protein
MRRFLIAGIAALAVAVVPGMASASHSGGNGPNYDKINGTGESFELGTVQTVHVNARSVGGGPAGQGSFYIKNSPFALNPDISGDVICHNTGFTGRPRESATVGVIRKSTNPVLVGAAVVLWIEDREPGSGQDTLFVGGFASPPPPSFCGLKPPDPKPTVTRGNFVAHDGA